MIRAICMYGQQDQGLDYYLAVRNDMRADLPIYIERRLTRRHRPTHFFTQILTLCEFSKHICHVLQCITE